MIRPTSHGLDERNARLHQKKNRVLYPRLLTQRRCGESKKKKKDGAGARGFLSHSLSHQQAFGSKPLLSLLPLVLGTCNTPPKGQAKAAARVREAARTAASPSRARQRADLVPPSAMQLALITADRQTLLRTLVYRSTEFHRSTVPFLA